MDALLSPCPARPETQLLVVEAAATPLLLLARPALRPAQTWTLAPPGGKLGEFALALTNRRDSLQTAALLLAPTVTGSDRDLLLRIEVARLLLQHLVSAGAGELVFVTSASAGRNARQELLALVDVFLSELGDAPLVISALFLEASGAARLPGAQRRGRVGLRLEPAA